MIASTPTHRPSARPKRAADWAGGDKTPSSSSRSSSTRFGLMRELISLTANEGSWLIADSATTSNWVTRTLPFGVTCRFWPGDHLDRNALDTIFEILKLVGRSCDQEAMREHELALTKVRIPDTHGDIYHIAQVMSREEYDAFAERPSRSTPHILLDRLLPFS
jgi:hypothetical protein